MSLLMHTKGYFNKKPLWITFPVIAAAISPISPNSRQGRISPVSRRPVGCCWCKHGQNPEFHEHDVCICNINSNKSHIRTLKEDELRSLLWQCRYLPYNSLIIVSLKFHWHIKSRMCSSALSKPAHVPLSVVYLTLSFSNSTFFFCLSVSRRQPTPRENLLWWVESSRPDRMEAVADRKPCSSQVTHTSWLLQLVYVQMNEHWVQRSKVISDLFRPVMTERKC